MSISRQIVSVLKDVIPEIKVTINRIKIKDKDPNDLTEKEILKIIGE